MSGQGAQPAVTRLSKALSLLLVVGFAVSYFSPNSASYLALVPGRTLPMIWNLVTSGFLITNPIMLVVDIGLLLILARVVEPTYGSKEFLKFIFVISLATGFSVFLWVYITFAATQNGKLLYTEFSGFHGVLAGLLVGAKHIMPDHEIKLLGFLKLRVKYLPSIVLLIVISVAVGLGQYTNLPFVLFGMYSAWMYLRFFQQQPEAAFQGDPSEEFKFSSFFPPFLAPAIDPIAALFGIVFRLRHTASADVKAVHMNGAPSMLGSDAADANRRRERGAKALEERLGLKADGSGDLEKATPAVVAPST